METNIIYKYRDPDAPPGSETTITTKALDLDPKEVLTAVHLNGETITLEADDPDKHGEGSREYVILERHPLITQWGGSGAAASILFRCRHRRRRVDRQQLAVRELTTIL